MSRLLSNISPGLRHELLLFNDPLRPKMILIKVVFEQRNVGDSSCSLYYFSSERRVVAPSNEDKLTLDSDQ